MFHCLLSDISSIIIISIFLGRAVDTPGNGKYLVGGFNAVQKRYLATCLRMRSTPEVDDIRSKHMRVNAMTKKVVKLTCILS